MNGLKHVNRWLVAILLSALGVFSQAANSDDIKVFINDALLQSTLEIETAKLALEKSRSQEVKAFANHMLTDHKKVNAELRDLAKATKTQVASESELQKRAAAATLKIQDDNYFDVAYANNQTVAHQQTIALLQRGANQKNAEIQAFSKKNLPRMEQHLRMAEQLVAATQESRTDIHQDREGKNYDTHQHHEDLHDHVE